ncbi:MAG: hypothetical protein KUG74_07080 [Rhodobacteraceae bacterium]|nr:hypothetical protein [Paracoccaceae bacterium]
MKKTLIATTMLIGLGVGFALAPNAPVFAQETSQTAEAGVKNWLDAMGTRVDLAQAKIAMLRARVALEIENSPEKAHEALDDAQTWVTKIQETTVSGAEDKMQALSKNIKQAKEAITEMPDEARAKIDALTVATEAQLLEFKQATLDTDEAKLLQTQYAQAEAHAALLQAQLAEKMDETGALATAYLDKAKAFYQSTKEGASENWKAGLAEISEDIDVAKQLATEKKDQAGAAIVDLTKRAADFVSGEQEK